MKLTLCSLYHYKKIRTPVGELTIVAGDRGVSALLWEDDSGERVPLPKNLELSNSYALLTDAERQLHEYFLGKRRQFDIPLAAEGTVFQKRVWKLLAQIPYGETSHYQAIAEKLGDPRKARPVGAANGNNPISIIVPCHRVIGKDGSLFGFAGGLKIKRRLLDLERQSISEGFGGLPDREAHAT